MKEMETEVLVMRNYNKGIYEHIYYHHDVDVLDWGIDYHIYEEVYSELQLSKQQCYFYSSFFDEDYEEHKFLVHGYVTEEVDEITGEVSRMCLEPSYM